MSLILKLANNCNYNPKYLQIDSKVFRLHQPQIFYSIKLLYNSFTCRISKEFHNYNATKNSIKKLFSTRCFSSFITQECRLQVDKRRDPRGKKSHWENCQIRQTQLFIFTHIYCRKEAKLSFNFNDLWIFFQNL